jgi:hypothetical protein
MQTNSMLQKNRLTLQDFPDPREVKTAVTVNKHDEKGPGLRIKPNNYLELRNCTFYVAFLCICMFAPQLHPCSVLIVFAYFGALIPTLFAIIPMIQSWATLRNTCPLTEMYDLATLLLAGPSEGNNLTALLKNACTTSSGQSTKLPEKLLPLIEQSTITGAPLSMLLADSAREMADKNLQIFFKVLAHDESEKFDLNAALIEERQRLSIEIMLRGQERLLSQRFILLLKLYFALPFGVAIVNWLINDYSSWHYCEWL